MWIDLSRLAMVFDRNLLRSMSSGQGTRSELRRWITLIRMGWLPTGLHFVTELPFFTVEGRPFRGRAPHNRPRGSPHRPLMPWLEDTDPGCANGLEVGRRGGQAVARLPWGLPTTSQAMTQMKPARSRPTAVVTCCLTLPARSRC